MKETQKIGAHVSTAGGLINAVIKAKEIGANCIQIFGSSPRQWLTRFPQPADVENFKQAYQKESIAPLFLHAAYLVNLASPDSVTREKSEKNLAEHLTIAERLGAQGLVFHLGSGKESPKAKAIKLIIESCRRILKAVPGVTSLTLENSAGGGERIGSSFEELKIILEGINSSRVKVCFDTAHAFEAGLIEKYDKDKIAALEKKVDRTIGFENLLLLHTNDSKTAFNSHHDRHENIGKGFIGIEGFRALARSKFGKYPWILETPGFDDLGPDKQNIDRLKKCLT